MVLLGEEVDPTRAGGPINVVLLILLFNSLANLAADKGGGPIDVVLLILLFNPLVNLAAVWNKCGNEDRIGEFKT